MRNNGHTDPKVPQYIAHKSPVTTFLLVAKILKELRRMKPVNTFLQ